MVTPGTGDFFNQPVLVQLLQGAAGFGTEFFRIPYAGENRFSNVPVAETVDQIPAITDGLHDAHYVGRSYVEAGYPPALDCFPGADGTDFLLYGFNRHDIRQRIKKPQVAGF